MGRQRATPTRGPASAGARRWLPALLVVCAGAAAYGGAMDGVFVLDDRIMLGNAMGGGADTGLQRLLAFGGKDSPAAGRPLVALSFLANLSIDPRPPLYAGAAPAWFHGINIAVHLGAALALLGLLRRSLERLPELRQAATGVALATALLWVVHPIHSGTITYISQRAEALMGLCFLLAFVCAERAGAAASAPRAWTWASVAFCWLSVLSKEVGAMFPLVFLLYDRAFLAGSFGRALRERRGLYAGLFSCWLLLAALLAFDPRPETVAWSREGLNPVNYAVAQAAALWTYLRVSIWPDPVVLDFGWPVLPMRSPGDLLELPAAAVLPLAALAVALGGLAVGLVRRPRASFLPAAALILLGPSSSVLPIQTEIAALHRMYLPLAAVLAALVLGGAAALRVVAERTSMSPRMRVALAGAFVVVWALALGSATRFQNGLYTSEIALWQHNLRHTPENPRVLVNLGRALGQVGRREQERARLDAAAVAAAAHPALDPHPMLFIALTSAAAAHRRAGDAVRHREYMERALATAERRIAGGSAGISPHLAVGAILDQLGRGEEAVASQRRALAAHPESEQAHWNLAAYLLKLERIDDARAETALMLGASPRSKDVQAALEHMARQVGRPDLVARLRRAGS